MDQQYPPRSHFANLNMLQDPRNTVFASSWTPLSGQRDSLSEYASPPFHEPNVGDMDYRDLSGGNGAFSRPLTPDSMVESTMDLPRRRQGTTVAGKDGENKLASQGNASGQNAQYPTASEPEIQGPTGPPPPSSGSKGKGKSQGNGKPSGPQGVSNGGAGQGGASNGSDAEKESKQQMLVCRVIDGAQARETVARENLFDNGTVTVNGVPIAPWVSIVVLIILGALFLIVGIGVGLAIAKNRPRKDEDGEGMEWEEEKEAVEKKEAQGRKQGERTRSEKKGQKERQASQASARTSLTPQVSSLNQKFSSPAFYTSPKQQDTFEDLRRESQRLMEMRSVIPVASPTKPERTILRSELNKQREESGQKILSEQGTEETREEREEGSD